MRKYSESFTKFDRELIYCDTVSKPDLGLSYCDVTMESGAPALMTSLLNCYLVFQFRVDIEYYASLLDKKKI